VTLLLIEEVNEMRAAFPAYARRCEGVPAVELLDTLRVICIDDGTSVIEPLRNNGDDR
jgi:hypothetical protein